MKLQINLNSVRIDVVFWRLVMGHEISLGLAAVEQQFMVMGFIYGLATSNTLRHLTFVTDSGSVMVINLSSSMAPVRYLIVPQFLGCSSRWSLTKASGVLQLCPKQTR